MALEHLNMRIHRTTYYYTHGCKNPAVLQFNTGTNYVEPIFTSSVNYTIRIPLHISVNVECTICGVQGE